MSWVRRLLAVCGLAAGLFALTPAAPAAAAGGCGTVRYAVAPTPTPHSCASAVWTAVTVMAGSLPILLTGWSCACGFAAGRLPYHTGPSGEWIIVRPRPAAPPRSPGGRSGRIGDQRQQPRGGPDSERAESLGRADDVAGKAAKPQSEAIMTVATGTPWNAPKGGTGPVQDPVSAAIIASIFAVQAGRAANQFIIRTPGIADVVRIVSWPLLP